MLVSTQLPEELVGVTTPRTEKDWVTLVALQIEYCRPALAGHGAEGGMEGLASYLVTKYVASVAL